MIQDVKDITSFKWATVTAVNPIGIKLDGDTATLALIPDSLVDPLTLGIGTRVRVELSLRKCVIHGVANGGDGFGSGDIVATARATARTGWMLCQGQSLLRSAFPRLFAAIGTTYGAADANSFSLPDARGRQLVGLNVGQVEFNALGQTGGSVSRNIDRTWLPMSVVEYATGSSFYSAIQGGNTSQYRARAHANPAESQTAMPTLDPYLVANYMIKL